MYKKNKSIKFHILILKNLSTIMKKKIEADLISLAHRVLRLKGKEDINKMYVEAQKLYEKIAILKFVEDNFETTKPTLSMPEIEELIDIFETNTNEKNINIQLEQPNTNEPTIIPDLTENIELQISKEQTSDILFFDIDESDFDNTNSPIIEEKIELKTEIQIEQKIITETKETPKPQQITLEDLLKPEYRETEFVRKIDINDSFSTQKLSLNDKLNQSITLGLNDRIAFEKQLFSGNASDLNRVISQINTFDSFEEAKNFIENMIKPDYNFWKDKELYEQRFYEIIAKKFN